MTISVYGARSSRGLAATGMTPSAPTDTVSHQKNMNRPGTKGIAGVSHLFHNSPAGRAAL